MSHLELLSKLANLSLLIFVVSNMLGFGMRLAPREVVVPLRQIRPTLLALLANFVIVPIAAYVLIWISGLPHGYTLGMVLLAISAGDPGVTKFSQLAKATPPTLWP